MARPTRRERTPRGSRPKGGTGRGQVIDLNQWRARRKSKTIPFPAQPRFGVLDGIAAALAASAAVSALASCVPWRGGLGSVLFTWSIGTAGGLLSLASPPDRRVAKRMLTVFLASLLLSLVAAGVRLAW
ncbi:hypothetical protein GCM10010885_00510 [Alicyclobacillus cellulosilyticus]|uniref:Uncharacterized protein n=1 Tax=Alicyclobacillus cellulosilyticus TaxID=1003997 RepID=A0A917JZM3_9BACL|nr:hypothetical protein [Alicyclobacillus cellulosilyticus]GGI94879.1 hypothetical protein GCM10010885_00510 [Alicyclobacillus cellulosilyticus]